MTLLPWLKLLLLTHASYLKAIPGLKSHLMPLQRLIEARSKTYRRAAVLKGKIEMILEQNQEKRMQTRVKPMEETLAALLKEPIAVYDESDDEEELVEVFDDSDNEVDGLDGSDDDDEMEVDDDESEDDSDDEEDDSADEDMSQEGEDEDDMEDANF